MIKFKCPTCGQDIEAHDEVLLDDHVDCPNCRHPFNPENIQHLGSSSRSTVPTTASNGQSPAAAFKNHLQPKSELHKLKDQQVDGIERQAGLFTTASIILAIVGIIGLFLGILALVTANSSSMPYWLFSGAFFGLALWIYLIAQVIRIRALLARK
jgi:hypothetical protein